MLGIGVTSNVNRKIQDRKGRTHRWLTTKLYFLFFVFNRKYSSSKRFHGIPFIINNLDVKSNSYLAFKIQFTDAWSTADTVFLGFGMQLRYCLHIILLFLLSPVLQASRVHTDTCFVQALLCCWVLVCIYTHCNELINFLLLWYSRMLRVLVFFH